MYFEFDPTKSDKNLHERGFDFAYATRVFEGRIVSFIYGRHDYGEVRIVAIGKIDVKVFTVIYTDRNDVRRIISAHHASRQGGWEVGTTIRMTAKQAKASSRIDGGKLDTTTEDDIARHMIEDGLSPDQPFAGLRYVVSPADVRRRTGLSQDKFARALGIPPATLRNWEQGRTQPDPVALAFFTLVDDDPQRAFRVLAPSC